MNPFRPLSISLSPNTERDDILLAFRLLFQPWRWKKESAELEREFKKYLGVKHAFSLNSGRSSLMAILSSAGFNREEEILLQAFTCNAVVNPILWQGLKPVFVDCDEKTFNIDTDDLKKKITSKSRAVIIQHTFGLPADIKEVLEICRKNNLVLIEDCAHSLGAEYGSTDSINSPQASSPQVERKKVGVFGKTALFSFSRDKVISSVYGGMVATDDEELAKKIKDYQKKIGYPSYFWIFQQLLHPVLMNWLILPTYLILGKYLLVIFQRLHILSKAVHWKEKRGLRPGYFPKRMPNALALLALNQLKKLDKFNSHRKDIADFYYQKLEGVSFELPVLPEGRQSIFLRFSIKHPLARQIIKEAWQKNLLIGDWYTAPIAPADTRLGKMRYIPGSCPKAEKWAKETLNLPTHINISKQDAQKIIDFLINYGNQGN